MRKLSGLFITAMLALSLTASFNGCGGGGASTSRGGGTDATLTAANAPQVGDAVTQAVKLVGPVTALAEVKGASLSPAGKAPLISIFENIVPVVRNHAANEKQSSALYTSPCPGGGSIEVGVPVPVSLDHVKADVNVNSCTMGSEAMNGALKVTVPVGAISDLAHVTEFTIEASSFTYSDPHSTISLEDNFTMVASGITYNGNSLSQGSLTLGGSVVGSIDGNQVNIGCDSLRFQLLSANTSGVTVSVSGRMSASCLGGWVIIGTNVPVFLPAHASCPTGGEVLVSAGGNNVTVHIAADSSITISFNGSVVHTYNNCNEVIGICRG